MSSVDVTYVAERAHHARRRRTLAAQAATPPVPAPPAAPVPIVQPVPGTAAAERAADQAARTQGARPHVLLDPDLAGRPKEGKAGMPEGMLPVEIADRIVATLLQGTGPILLCVPGTLGAAYETSMLSLARSVVKAAGQSVSVASIPYPNGIRDVVTRFFHIGTGPETNVLAMVLRKLHAAAPHRPIMLSGESQGAWLIADTLRADPELAAAVTRIAVFAKPGFVQMPESIGSARNGAAMLAATAPGVDGILEFRHTDDIVPSLFKRLGPHVLAGYVQGFKDLLGGGHFGYTPHHYDAHGMEAARWLLFGESPAANPVHESNTHPTHPPIP